MTTLRELLCCPPLHNPPNNDPRSILDEDLRVVCNKTYPYIFAGIAGAAVTILSREITQIRENTEITSFVIQSLVAMVTGLSFSFFEKKFPLACAHLSGTSLSTVVLILNNGENFNLRNTGGFFGGVGAVLITLVIPNNLTGARAELTNEARRMAEQLELAREIAELDRLQPELQNVLGEGGLEALKNDIFFLNRQDSSIVLNGIIREFVDIRNQEIQRPILAQERRERALQALRRLRENTPRMRLLPSRDREVRPAAIELENIENIRERREYPGEVDESDYSEARALGEGGIGFF